MYTLAALISNIELLRTVGTPAPKGIMWTITGHTQDHAPYPIASEAKSSKPEISLAVPKLRLQQLDKREFPQN